MVAAVELRKYTGVNAATPSGTITGIDFISADNATNSLANRQANPIAVGTWSYENWLKLIITTAPANALANFKVWSDGAVQSSTEVDMTAAWVTGQTPTNSQSTIADTPFTDYTAGNKADWFAGPISATGSLTDYLVMQLGVGSDATPGNWTQETYTYSYDET